jgi:hypothetical protein
MFMRIIVLIISILFSENLFAAGNYPEANMCPPDKPYYAICTDSMHGLEGWRSKNCHATREGAQKDADEHAKKYHHGNSRWTGVAKTQVFN